MLQPSSQLIKTMWKISSWSPTLKTEQLGVEFMGYLLISFEEGLHSPSLQHQRRWCKSEAGAQKHRLFYHDSVISLRRVVCFGYISKVHECLAFHVLVSF